MKKERNRKNKKTKVKIKEIPNKIKSIKELKEKEKESKLEHEVLEENESFPKVRLSAPSILLSQTNIDKQRAPEDAINEESSARKRGKYERREINYEDISNASSSTGADAERERAYKTFVSSDKERFTTIQQDRIIIEPIDSERREFGMDRSIRQRGERQEDIEARYQSQDSYQNQGRHQYSRNSFNTQENKRKRTDNM